MACCNFEIVTSHWGDAQLLHMDIMHCIPSERALEGFEQGALNFLDLWLCSEVSTSFFCLS